MPSLAVRDFPLLRATLLGGLALAWQKTPASPLQALPLPPTSQSQSLLAYLLLHTAPPPTREQLAALFWAERPPRRARRSLSTALWHIRRCFPEDPLRAHGQQAVQFAPPAQVWLDVSEFERLTSPNAPLPDLQQAVALYRGDLLEGFYDDWLLGLRYRLQALYHHTLARLIAAYETADEHQRTLQTALRLLTADPLSETACRAALRAYHRLGQREAMKALYQRFTATLRRELDAEPEPETSALYRRLRTAAFPPPSPTRLSQPPESLEAATPPAAAFRWLTGDVPPPLVGREAVLQRLYRLWGNAARGQGCLLLIGGEAGVGKTRILEALAAHARQGGGLVLAGQCAEFGSSPYAPLAEVLQAALAGPRRTLWEHLSPWQQAYLARLLPANELAPLPAADSELAQRHLLQALTRLLLTLAQHRPLVILLEDLHWAHEATLAWLRLLADQVRQAPLLVVGTYRREELSPSHPLHHLTRGASHGSAITSIALPPLTADALARWLPASPRLVQALYRHTEGNPFFVLETLRALAERGDLTPEHTPWEIPKSAPLPLPETVRQAIQMRRNQLPERERRALEAAAVLGKAFDLEVWQRTWGRDETATLEVLDTLLRRRWLQESEGPLSRDYEFVHHLGRESVYHSLPLPRRRELHRRAAQALLQAGSEQVSHTEIARHFWQAEAWKQAWPHLLQAGDQAVNMAATEEALACYRQALEAQQHLWQQPLPDAAVLHRKLGEVYFRRGAYREAETHLRQALALLGRSFPTAPGSIHRALLGVLLRQMGYRLRHLAKQGPPPPTAQEEVAAYTSLGWMYSLQGRHEEYLVVSLRALNVSEKHGFAVGEALASTALGIAADFIPLFPLAGYFHRRAAARLIPHAQPADVAFIHFGMAYHAYLTAQDALVPPHAARAAEAYRQAGAPNRWALAVLVQAYVHLGKGENEQAEALAAELQRTGDELQHQGVLVAAETIWGHRAAWQGQYAAAAEHFRRAGVLAAQVPDHMTHVESLGHLARCLLRLGEQEKAREALQTGSRLAAEHDVRGDSLAYFLAAAAEACLSLQQEGKAVPTDCRRALQAARRQAKAFYPIRPFICRLQARYAWLRGQRARARRLWQRSMETARHFERPLDWAIAACEAGKVLSDRELASQGESLLRSSGISTTVCMPMPE